MTLSSIARVLGDEPPEETVKITGCTGAHLPHDHPRIARNRLLCLCRSVCRPSACCSIAGGGSRRSVRCWAYYLARKLRMPDYGWKLALILFALLASVAVLVAGVAAEAGHRPQRRRIMVYEVDQTKKRRQDQNGRHGQADRGRLQAHQSQRREGSDASAPTASNRWKSSSPTSNDDGSPGRSRTDQPHTGTLEFRILANNTRPQAADQACGKAEPDGQTRSVDRRRTLLGWWVPVAEEEATSIVRDPANIRGTSREGQRREGHRGAGRQRRLQRHRRLPDVGSRPASTRSGSHASIFTFNATGGQLFGELTGSNLPDEVQRASSASWASFSTTSLQSAPYDPEHDHRPRRDHRRRSPRRRSMTLVDVLNAGSLPAALDQGADQRSLHRPHPGQRHHPEEHARDDHRRRSWCRCSCSGTTASPAWWP